MKNSASFGSIVDTKGLDSITDYSLATGSSQTAAEKSKLPSILSSVGMLSGLVYAFSKEKGFWAYIGYGILGGITGNIVGSIVVKVLPASKPAAVVAPPAPEAEHPTSTTDI